MSSAIKWNPAAKRPDGEELPLRHGHVRVRDGAAEICDQQGRLLLRYDGETLELAAAGDLNIKAGGRVSITSPETLELHSDRVDVMARHTRLRSDRTEIAAERLTTAAEVISYQTKRFELSATRIVEKSRETYREVAELLQSRAGRVRTLVETSFSLLSRSTDMRSTEETSIDGEKILLG